MVTDTKITVFGAGAFGTAIAHLLSQNGRDVVLWVREPEVVESIRKKKENQKFLPGIFLPNIFVTSEIEYTLEGRNVFVFAIPCQYVRDFLMRIEKSLPKNAILINLAKGIEVSTLHTTSQIFEDVFGKGIAARYVTLSGPTFAKEVALGLPTYAVVASSHEATAVKAQKIMSTKHFRLYSSTDVRGVELGGALKNIMAIGVGVAEGLGFGHNTRASLITRYLQEMICFGEAFGAQKKTFAGLSGVGDLMLTCYGDLSRNHQVGLKLGKGEKLPEILKSFPHVAEGVATTKAVHEIAKKKRLDMPNTEFVYSVLYKDIPPKEAFATLMAKELKPEF